MSKTETTTTSERGIDPKTQSKSTYGCSIERKQMLVECDAPLHVLDALGVEVPHREFNPEDAYEYPTTVEFEDSQDESSQSSSSENSNELDGTRVHLHQDVRETSDDEFGDFGAAEEDTDDVVWTVVDLMDETVTLTVVGEWSKRRHVPFEDFTDEYEPITCTTPVGEVPQFGY